MESRSDRFVPKVHPATRPVEPEDPYTLHATSAAGDPEVMLLCLVQEYAWMGWDAEQILGLFRDPSYPALNQLWDYYGEAAVRERVAGLVRETGVFRFHGTVCDGPAEEAEEAEPELVPLGIPARWRPAGPFAPTQNGPTSPGGISHAAGQ
jgi:hypothetical protein